MKPISLPSLRLRGPFDPEPTPVRAGTQRAGRPLNKSIFFDSLRPDQPIKANGKDYRFRGVDQEYNKFDVWDSYTSHRVSLDVSGSVFEAGDICLDCTSITASLIQMATYQDQA